MGDLGLSKETSRIGDLEHGKEGVQEESTFKKKKKRVSLPGLTWGKEEEQDALLTQGDLHQE